MRIAAAAVRVSGRTFVGTTHYEATLKLECFGSSAEDEREDGFLTDTGRFVNREEAFAIAVENGQAFGDLSDPVKNMNFYGTIKPRLESDMIIEYAELRSTKGFI